MKNQNNDVWVGILDKTNDPQLEEMASKEFYELPVVDALSDEKFVEQSSTNRRDFLKYLGFGLGAATLAASCEIPVKKAIPYVVKPDEIVPGVATYYASSFVKGGDYCSVLVKTREGRPIKIEGNPTSKVTKGGTSARAQAVVLDLYNTERFKSPIVMGEEKGTATTWDDLDKTIASKINPASTIRIVTNTILSPTTKKAIADFTAKYPNTQVVTYDPISSAAILLANEASFGDKVIPDYHFDKAQFVMSFGADFLGTWISPVEYSTDWVKTRKIKDVHHAKMSRLVVAESGMSLTGSNADNRILIKPSEQGQAILYLCGKLGGGTSGKVNDKAAAALDAIAKELQAAQGKALVVSNSNDKNVQIVVNKINELLGSYGNTITFGNASLQRQGVDSEVQTLIGEMNSGSIDAVFVMGGANPAYDLPNSDKFKEAFAKVTTKVSFAGVIDETTAMCNYVAPNNHLLESWGDAQPKRGEYSLIQPTINLLYDTRESEMSLLKWAGSGVKSYYDYLKQNWEATLFPSQSNYATFQAFWDNALHDGAISVPVSEGELAFGADVATAAGSIKSASSAEVEIDFCESVNIGNGQYADNPWLQEMPDPVMRTVWGNYLAINIAFDGDNNYATFKGMNQDSKGHTDIAKFATAKGDATLPVVPVFGQMPNTVQAGLGYGREAITSTGQNTGVNLYPMLSINSDGLTQYWAEVSSVEKAGVEDEFACVQYHHTMGVTGTLEGSEEVINVDERILGHKGYQGSLTNRTILRTSHVGEVEDFVHDLQHEREHHQYLNSKTLYPDYSGLYGMGHHWGMHIDLNACTGCAACTVACMAENNVPVVGKREVHRHHEMTWLRIDRYFYGDVNNPNVVYQPLMCQHCDNAPCENVCPVAATNHSSEGLNQMTYNRCIGTRYCANNCPFKVRRFNWLDYTTADLWPANQFSINGEELPFGADNLTRMVLNPDVTVRSRGVIEKCSFCVQRIQEGKLLAKREGRKLKDNDVKTACQTACPTGAIVFGDANNKSGELHKALESPLNYILLEEINVRSSVTYSAKVHNRNTELDA